MKARLAVIAALAGPGTAAAAEVEYAEHCATACGVETRFLDTKGEANDLVITGNRATIVVRDANTPLKAGEGCAQLDEHTARCPNISPWLDMGDGDDVVRTSVAVLAELGPGDDVFAGGMGDDKVIGGPGADRMSGGPGEDLFDPLDSHADVVDGGPDEDTVTYELGRTGITIDLARRRGPDGDALVGVENAIGTPMRDRISGDSRSNALAGGGGRDVLDGRGGADYLFGSANATFRCGTGVDFVIATLARRPKGCERLRRSLG
jgi:Ca2+-binding RTX toxin-like protein